MADIFQGPFLIFSLVADSHMRTPSWLVGPFIMIFPFVFNSYSTHYFDIKEMRQRDETRYGWTEKEKGDNLSGWHRLVERKRRLTDDFYTSHFLAFLLPLLSFRKTFQRLIMTETALSNTNCFHFTSDAIKDRSGRRQLQSFAFLLLYFLWGLFASRQRPQCRGGQYTSDWQWREQSLLSSFVLFFL